MLRSNIIDIIRLTALKENIKYVFNTTKHKTPISQQNIKTAKRQTK